MGRGVVGRSKKGGGGGYGGQGQRMSKAVNRFNVCRKVLDAVVVFFSRLSVSGVRGAEPAI